MMCLMAASSVVASPTTAVTRRRYSMLLSSVSPVLGGDRLSALLRGGAEPMLGDAVQRRVDAEKIPGDSHQHRVAEGARRLRESA